MKLAVCNSIHLWLGNLPLLLAKPLLRLLYQWRRRAFLESHQTLTPPNDPPSAEAGIAGLVAVALVAVAVKGTEARSLSSLGLEWGRNLHRVVVRAACRPSKTAGQRRLSSDRGSWRSIARRGSCGRIAKPRICEDAMFRFNFRRPSFAGSLTESFGVGCKLHMLDGN